MAQPNYNVVIIGGGIAGLSAAHALTTSDPSLKISLVETKNELGGKILTERLNGFIVEGGPDSFISYKPWAIELCKKIGLGDRLTGTNPDQTKTYILRHGKMMELPEGLMLLAPTRLIPFLRSPLFSMVGKLRMGLDLIIPKRKNPKDESLANFVRRRLGREAVERLAGPLLAGIYAGNPERMSVRATFPQFPELEQQYGSLVWGMLSRRRQMARREKSSYTMFMTLQAGLGEMVQAIEKSIDAVTVIKGHAVTRLSPLQESGYEIGLSDGRKLLTEAIVLATPAYVTGDLMKGFDRDLARELHAIRYVSTATVSMAFRKEGFSHPLNGFGFVVSGKKADEIMACTWTSTKFPHRAPEDHVLLRCFLGGEGREGVMELSDEAILQMVRKNLQSTMGITEGPVLAKVYRWTRANPQYDVGHLDRVKVIEEGLSKHSACFLAGAAYYGVGIPDCIRSGTQAAEKVLYHLKRK